MELAVLVRAVVVRMLLSVGATVINPSVPELNY